jgi:hypothetical protein
MRLKVAELRALVFLGVVMVCCVPFANALALARCGCY